ncbi:hypothetical protein BCR42DRAFT_419256 [Absidia repens]|uniref:Uncharacterized protein n=1 Tax=Absidia repens TaxID=90262 RepID=A0A1X2IB19_9FUNG|nr:hypothetical protein BCR42DRAFT_419256 [Absidia repens]
MGKPFHFASRILGIVVISLYVKISIPSLFVIIHTYQVRGYSSRPNNCTLSLPSISLHWLCFTWSTIKIKEIYYSNIRFPYFYYKNSLSFYLIKTISVLSLT